MTSARLLAILAIALNADCHRARPDAAPTSATSNYAGSYCWSDRDLGIRETLVVDLRLKSGHENRLPNAADSAAVRSQGGRILHAFQVAMLRAELDTTGLRHLIGGRTGIAYWAWVVRDTNRYDVRVQIFFDRAINERDSQWIASLGGQVYWFRRGLRTPLTAVLPESMLTRVRAREDVRFVRAEHMECVIPATGGGAHATRQQDLIWP